MRPSDVIAEIEASLPKNRHDPVSWRPRGIGLDTVPGCFVCGATVRCADAAAMGNPYLHNICAFVNKEDEEAALACFERGARMAYYHGDENAPQIKVGACDRHLVALQHVSRQWFISPSRIWQVVTSTLRQDERSAEEGVSPVGDTVAP